MQQALEQAGKAWGHTHPNPMVGALIVENGEVVATGYHHAAGKAHAEVDALRNLGRKPAAEASMFVTLEPCCTHGRTPPCTEGILASGIRQVFVGTQDPNPNVAGQGVAILRNHGVNVTTGILQEKCEDLNLLYNFWITHKSPLIAAKVATTLDGCIATSTGHSKWITSITAREDVMRWRRLFPAMGIGSGTALQDDPQLTSRLPNLPTFCPIRFVFDTQHRTLENPLRLHTDEFAVQTILVTTQAPRNTQYNSRYWQLPPEADGRPCLQAFRERCAEEGILGVMIEGGSQLLNSFIKYNQLDYLFAYRAPKILADPTAKPAFSGRSTDTLDDALVLHSVQQASLGDDQLLRGFFTKS